MKPEQVNVSVAFDRWSSFMLMLRHIAAETHGQILELGVGFHSTPFLHDVAMAGRFVLSIEEDAEWERYFEKRYAKANQHEFRLGRYDEVLPSLGGRWSIALLDHSPGPRRGKDMQTLWQFVDYFVIHDYHTATKNAVDMFLPQGAKTHVHNLAPPTIIVSTGSEIPEPIKKLS